uniref:Uncharacterized protein n=1 Tax=Oryza meridionalis TaxID=40149 RepID=A0A0E0CIH0_9ORYZ
MRCELRSRGVGERDHLRHWKVARRRRRRTCSLGFDAAEQRALQWPRPVGEAERDAGGEDNGT